MAIAFDFSSGGVTAGGPTSLTFSHTCSGSKRILFVASSSSGSFSGVTFNGIALTQSVTPGLQLIWILVNPPAVTANIICTIPGGQSVSAVSASYNGVIQIGYIDSQKEDVNEANPWTISNTVVASNCWLMGTCVSRQGAGNNVTSLSSNRTNRQTAGVGSTPQNGATLWYDSNGTVATGAQTTTVTSVQNSGGTALDVDQISLIADSSTPNSSNFLMMF